MRGDASPPRRHGRSTACIVPCTLLPFRPGRYDTLAVPLSMLAQLAPDRTRGHNAVHDAPHPHRKYFWFD